MLRANWQKEAYQAHDETDEAGNNEPFQACCLMFIHPARCVFFTLQLTALL